jgi:FtsP/CotA-like multicopper oxidase with cupredoxin domain
VITRRAFLKYTVGGTMLTLFGFDKLTGTSKAIAQLPGGSLDPTTIPKYVTPLVIPPAMPRQAALQHNSIDYYVIAVRQFQQQILPLTDLDGHKLPATTVWSYGSVADDGSFHYPAFTVEARVDRPVRVKWINELVDARGHFLPHLLPVDPTLHWANPPGGPTGRDSHPTFDATPGPYAGPVPIVTHLHGGHTREDSDGYAEAWYLPAAKNIPGGFARVGTWYRPFRAKAQARTGQAWTPGSAVFQYENDQAAATFWYHDHTLGMTRLNVYAGPAGFYLLRGGERDLPAGVLPGPAPQRSDEPGTKYYEIPIVVQDRSFSADGSLFYPDSRAFFDDFEGPYIGTETSPGSGIQSDISPIWNPEFFGNTMVVNGRTWPILKVEPRRYRFRFLNGCNSRFLILKIVRDRLARRPARPARPFWQIGADGGFLPAPVELDDLLLGPAERADVIVDFTGLPVGTELYLINEGPDEPFGGGVPERDFPAADPGTTGQVMKFVVGPLTSPDTSMPPDQLGLPAFTPLGEATNTRRVALLEEDSRVLEGVGPKEAELGVVDEDGTPVNLSWDQPITENPALDSTEIWEIFNFTEDAHPIHIHEVQFQVVDRRPFGEDARPPDSWEAGFKDTVIAYPGEITRVKALFDNPGLFVWHCHILEHEDNEMMRPYRIGP